MQITEKELERNSLINEKFSFSNGVIRKPKISPLNPVYVRNRRVVCRLLDLSEVDDQLTDKNGFSRPFAGSVLAPGVGGGAVYNGDKGVADLTTPPVPLPHSRLVFSLFLGGG